MSHDLLVDRDGIPEGYAAVPGALIGAAAPIALIPMAAGYAGYKATKKTHNTRPGPIERTFGDEFYPTTMGVTSAYAAGIAAKRVAGDLAHRAYMRRRFGRFGMINRGKVKGIVRGAGKTIKGKKKLIKKLGAGIGTSLMLGEIGSDVGSPTVLGNRTGGIAGATAGALLGASNPAIIIPTAGGYIAYKTVKDFYKDKKFHPLDRSFEATFHECLPLAAGVMGAYATEASRRHIVDALKRELLNVADLVDLV